MNMKKNRWTQRVLEAIKEAKVPIHSSFDIYDYDTYSIRIYMKKKKKKERSL